MKRSTRMISAAVCAAMMFPAGMLTVCAGNENTSAAVSEAENTYPFDEMREFLCSELDTANFASANTVSGKISLLEPFYMPDYLPLNGEYHYDEKNKGMFFPLAYNGRITALVGFSEDEHIFSMIYLSENAQRELKNGVSFFKTEYEILPEGMVLYGKTYWESKIFSIDGADNISFDFYHIERMYPPKGDPYALQNAAAVLANKPAFEKLSEYCRYDENSKAVYTFDYTYSGERNIVSGEKYHIRSKSGKYLSYSDGKYFLSDTPDSEFILTQKRNGSFSISPGSKPDKRMSVKKTGTFFISLSYYDGYCYSICRSDAPSSMLTASGNSVKFTDNEPERINVSLKEWYITKI